MTTALRVMTIVLSVCLMAGFSAVRADESPEPQTSSPTRQISSDVKRAVEAGVAAAKAGLDAADRAVGDAVDGVKQVATDAYHGTKRKIHEITADDAGDQ